MTNQIIACVCTVLITLTCTIANKYFDMDFVEMMLGAILMIGFMVYFELTERRK